MANVLRKVIGWLFRPQADAAADARVASHSLSTAIHCELVACDETGMPCFQTLMTLSNKAPALCLWCFDLLHLKRRRSQRADIAVSFEAR